MSNRSRRKAASAAASTSRRRVWRIVGAAGLVVAVALGIFALRAQPGIPSTAVGTRNDGAVVAAAEGGASGTILLKGGVHTVRHSTAPLPTAAAPRPDGRPTLVWFTATWCEVCESMAPYAHQAIAEFDERIASVEKSVDHDRPAASRFSVRGTPTFVLIDAQGHEVQRFFYQPDGARLRQTIDAALKKIGV